MKMGGGSKRAHQLRRSQPSVNGAPDHARGLSGRVESEEGGGDAAHCRQQLVLVSQQLQGGIAWRGEGKEGRKEVRRIAEEVERRKGKKREGKREARGVGGKGAVRQCERLLSPRCEKIALMDSIAFLVSSWYLRMAALRLMSSFSRFSLREKRGKKEGREEGEEKRAGQAGRGGKGQGAGSEDLHCSSLNNDALTPPHHEAMKHSPASPLPLTCLPSLHIPAPTCINPG
jgi:hypothetical protein